MQPKKNTRRKKKTTTPDIDDARFTENLALAKEVIALDNTDEDEAVTSQQPQQQVLPTGLAQYVLRNPPVIINPVGRGIWKYMGCCENITKEQQAIPTIWYSEE